MTHKSDSSDETAPTENLNALTLARRVNILRKQANDYDGILHTDLAPCYSKNNPYLPLYQAAIRELSLFMTKAQRRRR